MLELNPFSVLAETVSPLAMQGFIIAMVVLIAMGTIIQMIHHKNITYFFNNAKKAKLQATREVGSGEKVSIIAKLLFMILEQLQNLVLVKEDFHMSWECMALYYFGFQLQY